MSRTAPHCNPEDHPSRHQRGMEGDPAAVERAARLFRAMGDTARLRILQLLMRGEWCVTEIVEAVGEKFSTVSQRLRILRSEGLVSRRRKGTHLFYALADRHVAGLIENALAHAVELEPTAAAQPNGTSQPVSGTNNEAERTLRGAAAARKTGRTNKTAVGARRQTIIVSVLESLRWYLPQFTLSGVLAEIDRWGQAGQSCFPELLKKMHMPQRTQTILDHALPIPDG